MGTKHKLLAAVAFAALVLPGISLAQTQSVATLQQEIASLTAQLQSLESQLTAAGGSTTAWCYTFNTNLSIGMNGASVTALQTALQKGGGSVTVNGTFDDQTAAAVTAFQQKYQSSILTPYGLSNGTGYAGKSTRAELNSLFGCGGVVPNPVTPPIQLSCDPVPAGCSYLPGTGTATSCGTLTCTTPAPTSTPPITACPMYVPYCRYGGHNVLESNGCTQEVCNQAPAPPIATTTPATTPTPVITGMTSAGATPTPGSNEFLIGTNLPTQNATIVIDAGSANAQTIAPTGYNVGGGGNMTFFLPSSISVGTHTIEVQANGVTSNQFTFSVASASPTTQQSNAFLSPVSGTVWTQGSTQTIEWQPSVFTQFPQVPLGLYENGTYVTNIAAAPNTGSYSWTIPGTYAGSNFQVESYLGGGQNVASGMFSIVGQPSSITACPMFVPYCLYGGHRVVESNGCAQEVCNPTPVVPVSQ